MKRRDDLPRELRHPPLPVAAAFAAIHADTAWGSAAICRIAEAMAPGFTEAIDERIRLRAAGDFKGDLAPKARAIRAFRPGWGALFIHALALWAATRLVFAHDPYRYTYGDCLGWRRRGAIIDHAKERGKHGEDKE